MRRRVVAVLISAAFGAFLGCIAYLVDPKTLSLSGWIVCMSLVVVLGGIPGWYRKDEI